MKSFYHLVGLLVLLSRAAQAQTPEDLPPPVVSPILVRPDTARRVNQVPPTAKNKKEQTAADSAKLTERLFGMRFTRPGKAALLAAILPGAGQIYNRSWWKLPLVYAALGGTISGEVFYESRFREYVKGYNARTSNPVQPDPGQHSSKELTVTGVQQGIVFYRGYRDVFFLYIGLAYGLQVLDAVVDANFKDFDVSNDLSLHLEPTMLRVPGSTSLLPTAPGFSLALRAK